jgi:cytosine deaminase
MIPQSRHYRLQNVHIPVALLESDRSFVSDRDGLSLVTLEIQDGKILQIFAAEDDLQLPSIEASTIEMSTIETLDLKKKIILPNFVDIHTHLDKGQIWERSPNRTGTFSDALATVGRDHARWNREELYRRMSFGLQCSYAHGTRAIRTHLDSYGAMGAINFEVFKTLREEWADRISLEGVCLVGLDYFLTDAGVELADLVAEAGAILGAVVYPHSQVDEQLDRIFTLAQERQLNLDLHTDETDDPSANGLERIAVTAIRKQFTGKILCGHCCSLAVQSPEQVEKTLDLVQQAKLGIVSLPMCNLFLQDRKAQQTPIWRGVTRVHELKSQGIPVMFASDNCRDPFFGFGDHDGLEVFKESVRIAHLDTPYSDWCASVSKIPADWMDRPDLGRIKVGLPADFIIFNARYWSELLSRPQSDRILLRQGKVLEVSLPDYAELDDLILPISA